MEKTQIVKNLITFPNLAIYSELSCATYALFGGGRSQNYVMRKTPLTWYFRSIKSHYGSILQTCSEGSKHLLLCDLYHRLEGHFQAYPSVHRAWDAPETASILMDRDIIRNTRSGPRGNVYSQRPRVNHRILRVR